MGHVFVSCPKDWLNLFGFFTSLLIISRTQNFIYYNTTESDIFWIFVNIAKQDTILFQISSLTFTHKIYFPTCDQTVTSVFLINVLLNLGTIVLWDKQGL